MKILIVTGIYPPEVGGPAQYAKNLKEVWEKQGHKVEVKIFSRFQKIPWGLRHVVFSIFILPALIRADVTFALGTFSAGISAVWSKIFHKKAIFRTGGDMLWESYVDRTKDPVLLKDFYNTSIGKLNFKEKIMLSLIGWALRNLSAVIWSTEWQRDIFLKPYRLQGQKNFIVENYYGPKESAESFKEFNFLASSRSTRLKNLDLLRDIFKDPEIVETGAYLDDGLLNKKGLLEHLRTSYAVMVGSISEISPNFIIDAISCNKPFILTKENGLNDRIKDIGLFVDPLNKDDIKEKVLWLLQPENYKEQVQKISQFNFTHSWEEIAQEYLNIWKSL